MERLFRFKRVSSTGRQSNTGLDPIKEYKENGESKALGVGVNNSYFLENKKKWDQRVYYVIKDY